MNIKNVKSPIGTFFKTLTVMSIVSNNIKYLRRLNGLTQEQFARRIGIKRSLLGAYEEARANPNLENLNNIFNRNLKTWNCGIIGTQ